MQRVRLSREDRAILDLEGPTIVGHTCKVVVLDPPRPALSDLRRAIGGRLANAPELRRRLVDTGDPSWIEDRRLDLAAHVVDGGAAVGDEAFRERVATLFSEHLDRDRPLWRIDAVELPADRLALVWRLHHALADGTSAMRFASLILWETQAGNGDGASVSPAKTVGLEAEQADHRRRHHHLGALLEREFAESVRPSPFDAEVGRRRSVAFAEVPLRTLHDAAKRISGATVNDAVLSLVSGAIGRWLAEHDAALGSLRLRVPVSLHHEGDAAANRDSFFTLPAPVSEHDPVARLARIQAETEKRKDGHDAERLESLLESLGELSGRARGLAEQLEASSRSFALCVSNVPGPREPIAVCGAPVRSLYTLAEVGRRHGLRSTVVSAGGTLGFGFCADPAIVPDLERMAAAVGPEAEALVDASR